MNFSDQGTQSSIRWITRYLEDKESNIKDRLKSIDAMLFSGASFLIKEVIENTPQDELEETLFQIEDIQDFIIPECELSESYQELISKQIKNINLSLTTYLKWYPIYDEQEFINYCALKKGAISIKGVESINFQVTNSIVIADDIKNAYKRKDYKEVYRLIELNYESTFVSYILGKDFFKTLIEDSTTHELGLFYGYFHVISNVFKKSTFPQLRPFVNKNGKHYHKEFIYDFFLFDWEIEDLFEMTSDLEKVTFYKITGFALSSILFLSSSLGTSKLGISSTNWFN